MSAKNTKSSQKDATQDQDREPQDDSLEQELDDAKISPPVELGPVDVQSRPLAQCMSDLHFSFPKGGLSMVEEHDASWATS